MTQEFQKNLEAEVKKGLPKGVTIEQFDIQTVSRELGTLAIIELNHPSKMVVEEMPCEMPDPDNRNKMIVGTVTREYRTLLNESEIAERQVSEAMEVLANAGYKVEEAKSDGPSKRAAKPRRNQSAATASGKRGRKSTR